MTMLTKELVFIILDFLHKEKYNETARKLEQESGFFFSMEYFQEKVLAANWDEVEKYLSGFTNLVDNAFSTRLYFQIRKQKYLEALDVHDRARAVEIAMKDLKVFSTINDNLYKETTELLFLENFRQHEQFTKYGDIITERTIVLKELKMLIKVNPAFQGKLVAPTFKGERLRTLVNQSLNWQHLFCKYKRPKPHIETILMDHVCKPTSTAHATTPATLPIGAVANPTAYCPFPPTAEAANANALEGRITNATVSSSAPSALVSRSSIPVLPNQGQDTRTPTNRADAAIPVALPVGAVVNPAAYYPFPCTATAAYASGLAGRITNATVSSPAQSAPVIASSIPVLPNQGQYMCTPANRPHAAVAVTLPVGEVANPAVYLKGVDPTIKTMEKSRTLEDAPDGGKLKELTEIVDPSKCQVVTVPASIDPATTDIANKVSRILYTNFGGGILALGSNGIQKLWSWSCTAQNRSGKATASVVPQLWQSKVGLYMTNDVSKVNPQEAVPCIALSNNDAYVISSCGGEVSLFNLKKLKVLKRFMTPPPAPTFLAFHPQNNNILSVGMEDATIHIYNFKTDEVKSKLKGHQKRITGLAFSTSLNILVSSGADNQLCTWNTDTWEKGNTITMQLPAGKVATCQTQVQFHSDQVRLLVFCETQLAIYDASKMECMQQWVPDKVISAPVSCAAYSCNSQVVYAAFSDGNIGVFYAESLRLRCRIAPAAYLSPAALNSQNVGILVIATHPEKPNQFAIGMTDGTLKVLEPIESDGWWVVMAPSENSTTTTSGSSYREPD